MTRVLLTGGTGFIGRHCIDPLLARGYEVHAVSSRPSTVDGGEVTWHRTDLLNGAESRELVAAVQPTHLLHLAWYLEPGKFNHSIENVRWLRASLELLEAFSAAGGERAVLAGTCAEYDWSYGYCSETVTPLVPTTAFGRCKHALHQAFESLIATTDLSGAWGRVFFVYGPHEDPSRLVSSLTSVLLAGQKAPCSHGEQIRDYMHVADVGDAFAALLDSQVAGPVNLASGRPIPIKQVIAGIASRTGGADLVQWGAVATPRDDPPLIAADVRRLTNEVGWRPTHDLDSGLEQTVSWWRDHLAPKENP